MATCEKCWADAYAMSAENGKPQHENYQALLGQRKGNPCFGGLSESDHLTGDGDAARARNGCYTKMQARAEAAESEVTKLREALRQQVQTLNCIDRLILDEHIKRTFPRTTIHEAIKAIEKALAPSREGDNGPK